MAEIYFLRCGSPCIIWDNILTKMLTQSPFENSSPLDSILGKGSVLLFISWVVIFVASHGYTNNNYDYYFIMILYIYYNL